MEEEAIDVSGARLNVHPTPVPSASWWKPLRTILHDARIATLARVLIVPLYSGRIQYDEP